MSASCVSHLWGRSTHLDALRQGSGQSAARWHPSSQHERQPFRSKLSTFGERRWRSCSASFRQSSAQNRLRLSSHGWMQQGKRRGRWRRRRRGRWRRQCEWLRQLLLKQWPGRGSQSRRLRTKTGLGVRKEARAGRSGWCCSHGLKCTTQMCSRVPRRMLYDCRCHCFIRSHWRLIASVLESIIVIQHGGVADDVARLGRTSFGRLRPSPCGRLLVHIIIQR
mmetsp:Transcript_60745/g.114555  ORF Transcript_60745/g.114555 Transcript_60745/m.114555 type:complete len:222 (-) Transcript_60745:1831-2496(-)